MFDIAAARYADAEQLRAFRIETAQASIDRAMTEHGWQLAPASTDSRLAGVDRQATTAVPSA